MKALELFFDFLLKTVTRSLTVLVILLFVFVYLLLYRGDKVKALLSLYQQSQDTVTLTKLGYRVKILETENYKLLSQVKTKDSLVRYLQQQVTRYRNRIKHGGAVTVVKTETRVDTVFKAQNKPCELTLGNKWYNISLYPKNDSTALKMSFKHKFTVVTGEKRKWFKRVPYAYITDENPYTQIKNMKAFRVVRKRSHFSVGLQAGYGVTTKGLSPYVGFGININ